MAPISPTSDGEFEPPPEWFELPRGAGRIAAAAESGARCGEAWRRGAGADGTPPPYRYPAPVAAWSIPLRSAWFDAYIAASLETPADEHPVAGVLASLPESVDGSGADAPLIEVVNDAGELAGLRRLDDATLQLARRQLDRWREKLMEADVLPDKSRAALLGDLRTWHLFCRVHRCSALPATHDTLEAFVMAMGHPTRGLAKKRSTVKRYLASIARMHRAAAMPNPTNTERMRLVLRELDAAYRRANEAARKSGDTAPFLHKQATGLTDEWLDVLTPLYDDDSLRNKRDLAVLWVAKSTLCRISELAALLVEDLSAHPDGTTSVRLNYTKTNQRGDVEWRIITPEARGYLEAWLGAAAITDGALFRGLRGGKAQDKVKATGLTTRTLQNIYARANDKLKSVGVAGAKPFSGHSARVGAAEDMASANIGTVAIQLAGGWKSPQMPMHYARQADVRHSGAAQLAALRKKRRDDG